MSGFANPIVDDQGNLRIASIQSPGFSVGPPIVGWQVDKNGQAFFQSISVGTGVQRIFVQATAPVSPNTNDLWINTSSGNVTEQWNGSTWVVYQVGTNAIANGSITAALIAAGVIYAGIVNGTEIDGAIFRAKNASGATIMTINKTAATWILYNDTGSATQGAMVASGSNAQVTDEFANTVLAGITSYFGSSGAWAALTLSYSGASGAALAWFFSSQTTQTTWVVQASLQNAVSGALLIGNGGFGVNISSTDQLSVGAGMGPFIQGETWHGITLPSTGGFTGTIRVKKLPWNAIWLDVQVRWTGTTGTNYICGALPDASYYPTTGTPRFFNIAYGDTPNSDLLGNVAVPASPGGLTIFTNSSSSGSGTSGWYGCSVMYPTN